MEDRSQVQQRTEKKKRTRQERRFQRRFGVESPRVTRLKQVSLAVFLIASSIFMVVAFLIYD